jgi:hypothetical protein
LDVGCGALFVEAMVGGALAAAGVWFLTRSLATPWSLLALVLGFVVGMLLALAVVTRFRFHERMHVVDQVHRYPGHERWVAIPSGSWSAGEFEDLRDSCRRHGLGLLEIGRGDRAVEHEQPRVATTSEDLLSAYVRAEWMREQLRSR